MLYPSLIVVSALLVASDTSTQKAAEAERLHNLYRLARFGSSEGEAREKIVRFLNDLKVARDEKSAVVEIVDSIGPFLDYPRLRGATARCLVEIGGPFATGKIEPVVRQLDVAESSREGPEKCQRLELLNACQGLSPAFSPDVVQLLLTSERHADGVRAVLTLLSDWLNSAIATKVLAALEQSGAGRRGPGLSALPAGQAVDLVVELFVAGLGLDGGTSSSRIDPSTRRSVLGFLAGVAPDNSRGAASRQVALRVLARAKEAAVLESIGQILQLERSNRSLVLAAVRAAVDLGDPAAGAWMLPLMDSALDGRADSPEAEDEAILMLEAISALRIETARRHVMRALKSKNSTLRLAAVTSVAGLGDEEASRYLSKFLDDRNWQVQRAAIEGCRRLRSRAAVELLIRRMDQQQGRLRYDLLMALHDLTGVKMPYVVEDWEKWWSVYGQTWRPPETVESTKTDRRTEVLFPDGGKSTYFGLKVLSRRICFIGDASRSMGAPLSYGGAQRPRIEVMKDELLGLVQSLDNETRLNIFLFASEREELARRLLPVTRKNVSIMQKFLGRAQARGGTNLFDPLERALLDPEVDTIYLLSDGEPSEGRLIDPEAILERVGRLNRFRGIQIHTISIGGDSPLLRELARASDGQYRVVE